MPLQRSRSKSKTKDKKSSAEYKKDKKVVKKSSVKTASSDGKVSQIAKQSVVVNVGDVATKKKRGRPRMKKPAKTAPPPPRFVEPPQSGLVQQAPQQIYRPPPFPSQNLVQPQPQRDALAPRLPTSVSVRQTLDQAQSESRVQAQNQARIESQRRLQQQQQSRSVGDVEPSQRLKKQQEARLKKLVPADAPKVEPPPKVAPPKVDPNPLSGESKTEITDKPTDKDVMSITMTRLPKKALQAERSKSRERRDELLVSKQNEELLKQQNEQHLKNIFELEAKLARSQLGSIPTPSVGRSQPSSTIGTHPLQEQEMRKKFELPPPYQVEVTDRPSAQARYSSDVPFAQAQPVERDPLSLTFEKTPAEMIQDAFKARLAEFRKDVGEPSREEYADLRQLAEQDVFVQAP